MGVFDDYNFERKEFACKCGCGFDPVDVELLDVLQRLRDHVNKPITILSGCRCEDHNENVGGAPDSQHVFGKAADISVSSTTPAEVFAMLDSEYRDSYGIGLYSGWVHIDVRPYKARW